MGVRQFITTTAGKIVLVVVGVVLTLVIAGATLYASDYGVEATVVDKKCSGQATVTVKEAVTGFEHTQPIGTVECAIVESGNFVVYNLRSERVRVWDIEGGELLWDSQWLQERPSGLPF